MNDLIPTQIMNIYNIFSGGTPNSLIGVSGESSGGQCAIHATHQLKAALDFQVTLIFHYVHLNHV